MIASDEMSRDGTWVVVHAVWAQHGTNWLIDWLNDPSSKYAKVEWGWETNHPGPPAAGHAQIELLIENLQGLFRCLGKDRQAGESASDHSKRVNLESAYIDQVEEIMGGYIVTPGFYPSTEGIVSFDRICGFASANEYYAYKVILAMGMGDSLDKLARCVQCRESWFWRWRTDSRFCSSKCRQRHYESSPEGKEWRRKANRRAYEKLFPNARKHRREKTCQELATGSRGART